MTSLPHPLIKTGDSDAGGVSARKGFRFQDVVAASLAVDMLQDPRLVQIECETADDIVLRWDISYGADIEYIQVKTTENDSKWTLSELTSREKNKKHSSVCEKSLLCDCHGGNPRFRLVTTRDVRKNLRPFRTVWPLRDKSNPELIQITAAFSGKYKDVVSPSGRSLADWASALYWQVEPDEEALRSKTINLLLKIAQGDGYSAAWSTIDATYRRLLSHMADMADAPKSNPLAKRWARKEILEWWKAELEIMRQIESKVVKVYRTPTSAFFSELQTSKDGSEKRQLHSYDAEYDGDKWRRSELIDYLIDWIPEISLPPSMLATFGHLNARRLSSAALRALDQHGVTDDAHVISNLLLHCILRHHFNAEPIACKLFYLVGGQMRSTSAHIIQDVEGDQLWLGRSRLVTTSTYKQTIKEAIEEMKSALDPALLKEDRDVVVRLRDPQHLRADSLGRTLSDAGKVNDLLGIMRLPILIAYDSDVLSKGYADGYIDKLKAEVIKAYMEIKLSMDGPLNSVEIIVFFVPVECAKTLADEFGKKLRGSK